MIREELARLFDYQERHRRLAARLLLAAGATFVVFLIGTWGVWLTVKSTVVVDEGATA